jgi:hypothetical protein
MAITRDFKETVQARALRDTAFREGLLRECVENMLAGDTDTGKALLRDYIKEGIRFEVQAVRSPLEIEGQYPSSDSWSKLTLITRGNLNQGASSPDAAMIQR